MRAVSRSGSLGGSERRVRSRMVRQELAGDAEEGGLEVAAGGKGEAGDVWKAGGGVEEEGEDGSGAIGGIAGGVDGGGEKGGE